MSYNAEMIKTRFCLISDTHTVAPFPETDTEHAYRLPLPSADVLLHGGDLTTEGGFGEYEITLEVLKAADAELKIVIAGNHDKSLDEPYFLRTKPKWKDDVGIAKQLWTSHEAKKAGVVYLEEGLARFKLKNGANFTIYTSPYTPEYCDYAFPYERHEDRYNPPTPTSKFKAANPIPSWPDVDILLTHGPPQGILDATAHGELAGCQNLLAAVKRCRPRLHCFGHIHESRGAKRYDWSREISEFIHISKEMELKQGSSSVDIGAGGGKPLRFGEETLFVNASIMNIHYQPKNAPWIVDLDLPAAVSKHSKDEP